MVRRIAVESEPQAGGPDRIVVVAGEATLVGSWHRMRLERAVANVLGNALKYSRPGSRVVLSTEREGRWAVLRVRDRGVGIPAGELARVCEPFYRASNVAHRFPGSGLGLASVHGVAEAHGGTVSVDSEVGIGTTVTLRLPLDSSDGGDLEG